MEPKQTGEPIQWSKNKPKSKSNKYIYFSIREKEELFSFLFKTIMNINQQVYFCILEAIHYPYIKFFWKIHCFYVIVPSPAKEMI